MKIHERLALRKSPRLAKTTADILVEEIRSSFMHSWEVTREEAKDLVDSFGIDMNDHEPQSGVARLVMHSGGTLLVCGVDKVSEDWIRCYVVGKKSPHALIRTSDVVRVVGSLFG